MIHKEILEDLLKDASCMKDGSCDERNWCILRELIPYIQIDDRMAEQMILIYDYKFMESKRLGFDIGKERAFMEFIQKYGKKFAESYQDGKKNGELFEAVFGVKKQHTEEDIRKHITNN